jgi:sugar transferase (PEP-CTERM system associated)
MWPSEGIACVGRRILFVVFETLLLIVGILAGYALITWGAGRRVVLDEHTVAMIAGLAAVCQVAFYYSDLYGPCGGRTSLHVAERLFRALGVTAIVMAVGAPGVPPLADHATVLLAALTFPLLVIPVGRRQYPALIRLAGLRQRVLILGDGPAAHEVLGAIRSRPELGYDIVRPAVVQRAAEVGTPRCSRAWSSELPDLIKGRRVDIVTVALEDPHETVPLSVRLACRTAGVTVVSVGEFYERVTGRVLVDRVTPGVLLHSVTPPRQAAVVVKRIVDVCVAAVLLVLAAPVMALVALLIRWDSPGPVLYAQERVGFRGRPFTLYKFRSMRQDAEAETGPVWAAGRDPRVTRVGRFLRASRLDESPQLWNVIKGDMSLVGPRPERPVFVERLIAEVPCYAQRHLLKPGVTGWAQVSYPYGASVADARAKLTYDLYYVLRWSLVFDLLIIVHTIKIVLCGRGAR